MLSRCASLRAVSRSARFLSTVPVRAVAAAAPATNTSSATADSSLSWKKVASLLVTAGALGVGVAHAEAPPEVRQPPYMHPPNVDEPHEDRATRLAFEKKISVETDAKLNNIHVLVGTGCKYKYGFMKLYAVGLYLPPGYAKATGTDDRVLAPIINGETAASLVIRVNSDTNVKGFMGHLESALRDYVNSKGRDKEKANVAVNLLRDMVIGGAETTVLPKGGSLRIVREGNKLFISVQDKKLGNIESEDLAQAVFGVYLGQNPLSEEAKAAFGRGIRGDKYHI